ncbi:MAG: hypothetical protein JWL77_3439, partial [Chthonomonadaceae bacterium]|nr:hypothetical protein [Chthonomonadaceae bacterium]
ARLSLPLMTLLLVLAAPFATRCDDTPMPLTVPAYTAYSEPDPDALDIGEKGLTHWTQGSEKLVWYGKFAKRGPLSIHATVRTSVLNAVKFQLTVGEQVRTAQVPGADYHAPVTVDFGTVTITEPGYQRIVLQALEKTGGEFGDVSDLVLSGPAAEGAHFNTIAVQRGAPSVHLSYPIPKEAQVTWFYNEVTAKTDPLWTYYMACGWHRGYFGMQVNSPTERRVIFSVWDSGKEAKDRSKVEDDNRVKLLAKGDGVFADSFGNEGTGGHSHLVYPWKTGKTYRFLVAAQVDGDATLYSGYFYFPEKHRWGLIARFRAPKDGAYLHGLYSFDEDFNSANGQQKRLADFGRQWVKTTDGKWTELTDAIFTHTGKEFRTDYDAGAIGKQFYLAGGGYEDGKVKYRDTVQRPSSGKPPTDIVLPSL